MNRGSGHSSGYTIVEALIFLAVSGVLFVSAMTLISGQQAKTEFSTTVRDFESNLIDIANDIASGYYQSSGSLPECSTISGEPNIPSSGTAKDLGTNRDCILVGRVIKPTNTSAENYDIYSLVGRRTSDGVKDVATLDQAKPRLITQLGTHSTKLIGFGASIQCISLNGAPCSDNKSALGFFSNLSKGLTNTASNQSGTGINAVLYAYPLADFSESTLQTKITGTTSYGTPLTKAMICLKSGTSNQYAQLTIGLDTTSNLSIKSQIGSSCS